MEKIIHTQNGEFSIAPPPKSGHFALRLALKTDCEALLDLEKSAFDSRYAGHLMDRRACLHAIGAGNGLMLVCLAQGQIAGYALVHFRRDSLHARLYSIAVSPERAGQGLGSALLKAAEACCEKAGISHLGLEVHPDNMRAVSWYAKSGFVMSGKSKNGYYADGAPALKMLKIIH